MNIQELFNQYNLTYKYVNNGTRELIVRPPRDSPGVEIWLHGALGDLANVKVTYVQIDGLGLETEKDSDINEQINFKLVASILAGQYSYNMQSLSLRDRLSNGAIYLSIGPKGVPLLKDYRCVRQSYLKKRYKTAQLDTAAYPPSS